MYFIIFNTQTKSPSFLKMKKYILSLALISLSSLLVGFSIGFWGPILLLSNKALKETTLWSSHIEELWANSQSTLLDPTPHLSTQLTMSVSVDLENMLGNIIIIEGVDFVELDL